MLATLPRRVEEIMDWQWSDFEPYVQDLQKRHLDATNIEEWLADWTALSRIVYGRMTKLRVATDLDTTDAEAERKRDQMIAEIIPPFRTVENHLTEKLLNSGLEPQGMKLTIKKLRTQNEIFCEDNLPLQVEEQKLQSEYSKIVGAQTVTWDGQEMTLTQLSSLLQSSDRVLREKVWRAIAERQLQDSPALNALWVKLLELRQNMANNAGFESYREYRWKQFNRFDYTPEDCTTFHDAIEQVVVPAAKRLLERRKQQLGVAVVRPWDVSVDPQNRAPLRPYEDIADFDRIALNIFRKVDPQLGEYFSMMREEKLLDLANHKGKGPGGYCTVLPVGEDSRPFIFMNSVGLARDVTTLLHEAGHAFHVFEANKLPYIQQRHSGAEFAEVASMSMELLGAPYLAQSEGGYFGEDEAARARIEHLEKIISFWPYMAVVDAFQHWAYTNADLAIDPLNCDAKWGELWQRFMPGEDWDGLEDVRVTGWHRKQHIYQFPFYYVDYGLAQLGAVQVWARSLQNQSQAVNDYIQSLRLGGTASLPELYAAAGGKFAFDTATVGEAVSLVERTLQDLYDKE